MITCLSTLNPQLSAAPLGTAFTYQGRLTDGGQPANGTYDLKFILYDDTSAGSAVAGPITNSPVAVTNGLFTVALDFGEGVFTGDARWLEIAVRTGTNDFTVLSPRQELTPTPYALYAPSAGAAGYSSNLLGVLPASQLAGTYTNTVVFTNSLNSFIGSNVTVGGSVRAGGDLVGARLNVGVGHRLTGGNSSIAGGASNTNDMGYSFIGGGNRNSIQGYSGNSAYAVIGGGQVNTIQTNGNYGTVGGGMENLIEFNVQHGTIGGGWGNVLQVGALRPTIAGGSRNTNAASWSAIGGGTGQYHSEQRSLRDHQRRPGKHHPEWS